MKNAIARHSWNTGHVANWVGLKIIGNRPATYQKENIREYKNRHIRNNYNLDIRNASKSDLVPIP